jgi:hypothetical protein
MSWVIRVVIPKGRGGDYCGIGLLEPVWKVLEKVMDLRLEAIVLHDSLHGCLTLRGMGTGIIETKLVQQLTHLEQMPFFGIFIDLRKAFFDTMDWGRCLRILALHRAGPQMLCLIRNFWDMVLNICQVMGNYGQPFKAGCSVTQGGPLLAKFFNIIVDVVVHEWMRLMRETIGDAEGKLVKCIVGLFAVFYIDDGYIASCNAEFLQEALNILIKTLKHVGLAMNMKKTQAMICTPGRIWVQLPTDSYKCMRKGVAAGEEPQRAMVRHVCNKPLQARSLRLHLSSAHDIHQQVVVAEALLEEPAGVCYMTDPGGTKKPIQCPFSGCPGRLSSPYMLRHHFRNLHPKDTMEIPREGTFPQCKNCRMQCNPWYPWHIHTQMYMLGAEQRTQQDSAITAALALHKLFLVEEKLLEKVDLF